MHVIIVHRLPESHQHSMTDVCEGTDLGVFVTFHSDELAPFGYISSLVLPHPPFPHVGKTVPGTDHQPGRQ